MNENEKLKIEIIRRVVNMSNEKALSKVLDLVQYGRKVNIKAREFVGDPWPEYEGFGEIHTCGQWASIAGLHRNTFRRYLKKGMTVEEIFEKRHRKPPIK